MAIVRISHNLLCDIIQRNLLLPNRVNIVRNDDVLEELEIITEIEGFADYDQAKPIYRKSEDGTVNLLRIDHA